MLSNMIIYDGLKDTKKNSCIIEYTEYSKKIIVNWNVGNRQVSMPLYKSGLKIINHKHYIIIDQSIGCGSIYIFHKYSNTMRDEVYCGKHVKLICYDSRVYVWCILSNGILLRIYGSANSYRGYEVHNIKDFNKDISIFAVKYIKKYRHRYMDYGKQLWPTPDATIEPNIFKGIVTGLTDIALVCP